MLYKCLHIRTKNMQKQREKAWGISSRDIRTKNMQKQREKAWGISSRDLQYGDVTDSKGNSLFTFLSTATEELEN